MADRPVRILLGVTGGVAAFKAIELARGLMAQGMQVQVVMTDSATRFITPASFQALTGEPVYTDAWDSRIDNLMPHIELSRAADLILVAPATADFMAKVVHGLADDLLSTLCLAREIPLLMAPAMNRQMWENRATQRNVALLADDGVELLGPTSGAQACGETGLGRMIEPQEIIEATLAFLAPKWLAGRKVLVTAGPTYEPIDPVRGITNRSSGKMGFEIARAARHAGASVELVAGPVALDTPWGVQRHDVRTAVEMHDAVMARAATADVFIAVAAVADWRVARVSDQKIKKTPDGALPTLEFTLNPDILARVAALADAPYCVGFAAESEALEQNAQKKRISKGVPLLAANIGHQTFGLDENEFLLIDEQTTTRLERASKAELATRLVEEIAKRLPRAGSPQR